MVGCGSTEDMGKMALVPPKEEKGELSLGPMVTSGWKSKDCSSPAKESVSLVGKSTGMPETTSGVLHPDYWGWSHEVGSPTMILRQKATRGTSLAHLDGEIYEIDALRP